MEKGRLYKSSVVIRGAIHSSIEDEKDNANVMSRNKREADVPGFAIHISQHGKRFFLLLLFSLRYFLRGRSPSIYLLVASPRATNLNNLFGIKTCGPS